LQAYLDAEVDELLERARYQRRDPGQPAAHRHGYDRELHVFSNRGPIALRRPRVRGAKHESAVLPKRRRRLENVDTTLNEGWLRGLSQRDCEPTLRALLGAKAPLSASTIVRVSQRLHDEYVAWKARPLDEEILSVWADGIYLGSGPDDERRVFLVVIGADRTETKHLLALEDALAESEKSWLALFAELQERGLKAPALFITDGAQGLWAAVGQVFAGSAQQRCWKHKIANVLGKLPKKGREDDLAALREIMYDESEAAARRKLETLAKSYARSRTIDRIRRQPRACATTLTAFLRIIVSRLRNTRICARRTRSNRFSPRCVCERMPRNACARSRPRRSCSSR